MRKFRIVKGNHWFYSGIQNDIPVFNNDSDFAKQYQTEADADADIVVLKNNHTTKGLTTLADDEGIVATTGTGSGVMEAQGGLVIDESSVAYQKIQEQKDVVGDDNPDDGIPGPDPLEPNEAPNGGGEGGEGGESGEGGEGG